MRPCRPRPDREILVTEGRIRAWARPTAHMAAHADASGLDAMIEDFVREEVMVREALAEGLDRDDTVVRRRCGRR